MFPGVKEFKLELPDHRVDCITFGRGERPLVMIQGLNTRGIRGAGLSLAWMYRAFAATHRVYLFDRRPDLPEGVTVQELAEDTARYMDALGLTGADVLGVSQGGMMAQYLAMERPNLVRKLVLAFTLARTNDTVRECVEGWIALAGQGRFKEMTADMALRLYSPAYVRRYLPFLPLLAIAQRPKDTGRFIALARACLTCETCGELSRITCPTLVIGGGQDRVVGPEASRELAAALNCPIYMYEDLGHAAYEEAAKDFNGRVLAFLNG